MPLDNLLLLIEIMESERFSKFNETEVNESSLS